jgi:uncharacterized protein YggE
MPTAMRRTRVREEPATITEEQQFVALPVWLRLGSRHGPNTAQNVVAETRARALEEGATIAPGQITVNARVSVTFALK